MANTTPDSSQIVFRPDDVGGAPQVLQSTVRALIAASGGGGSAPLGGLAISNFTLDQATPSAKVIFTDTNSLTWSAGPGRVTVTADFVPTNYFAANPSGHVAIVTRCDTAVIATQVRGTGVWFGNLSGYMGLPDYTRAMGIETWFNGVGDGNYLFTDSVTPRNKQLVDGGVYRLIIDSTKTALEQRFVRYRLFQWVSGSREHWDLITDTGDVLDHNSVADLTQDGLVFGHVLGENLSAWSIPFTNVKVSWGPADEQTAATTHMLNRRGAELDGDLTFTDSRRIRVAANPGPSLAASTAVQARVTNAATSIVMLPNGTSTTSNIIWSNNSLSTTAYGAVTLGMSGTTALLQTFALVDATPDFGIDIGFGTRRLTAAAAGVSLFGATVIDDSIKVAGAGSRKILVAYNAGPSLATSTKIQAADTNQPTTVVMLPNGTSSSANMMFSNNSLSTTTYGAVVMGMTGSTAVIETFGYSAANPEIGFNVGASTRIFTVKADGLRMQGATYSIGTTASTLTGLTSTGGAAAVAYTTSAFNLETFCTDGTLRTFMSASPSNVEVEQVLRGAYCMISSLIQELRTRKVI